MECAQHYGNLHSLDATGVEHIPDLQFYECNKSCAEGVQVVAWTCPLCIRSGSVFGSNANNKDNEIDEDGAVLSDKTRSLNGAQFRSNSWFME